MKVVWTEQAVQRLQEIEDYISRDSPDRAIRFVNRLVERGEDIGAFPDIGRQVPELSAPNIREVIEQGYRIVYLTMRRRVEILTVFEGHRELPSEDVGRH